jgi:hypothetical protein
MNFIWKIGAEIYGPVIRKPSGVLDYIKSYFIPSNYSGAHQKVGYLPRNYVYSSGKNYARGFKDIGRGLLQYNIF